MTWPRLASLLVVLTGCGSPLTNPADAAPASDASPSDAASNDAGTDATLADDAGAVDCDRDHDGFVRAAPECPPSANPDCDDDDPRTYPGAPIVCRDGHISQCGQDRELADLAGTAELGMTSQWLTFSDGGGDRAIIVAERIALLGPGAGALASWNADGIGLSPITEAILGGPPQPLEYPVLWHAAAGTMVRAAAMGVVARNPLVAMLDDTTVHVLQAGLPPLELLAASPTHGRFVSVVSVLDIDDEPMIVSATEDAGGSTFVHLHSAAMTHESPVRTPPTGVEPWLASAGHTVLWSWPGSSVVELVDARTGDVTSWSLGAPALGRGSIAAVPDMLGPDGSERIVAVVATSLGIETLDRVCVASGCTSPTSTFVLPSAPSGPTHVAISQTTAWEADLLVLSVMEETGGSAHLYLVRAPSTVLADLEIVPSGAHDVAMASTDRYGGRLVLGGTRAGGASHVTGLLFCDIQ